MWWIEGVRVMMRAERETQIERETERDVHTHKTYIINDNLSKILTLASNSRGLNSAHFRELTSALRP